MEDNIVGASEQKNPSDGCAMEVPRTSSRRSISGGFKSPGSVGSEGNGQRMRQLEEKDELEDDELDDDELEEVELPPIPTQSPVPPNCDYRPGILSKGGLEASMLGRTAAREPTNATAPDSPRFPLTKVGYIPPPGSSPNRRKVVFDRTPLHAH
ncbi:hypothetical protein RSAG8_07670, partial [Rhizoctonia solani AG-8 WAC10335]